ncbi:MAG: hypothetical protein AAF202_04580, partial [Pseudomonadota bacterium]
MKPNFHREVQTKYKQGRVLLRKVRTHHEVTAANLCFKIHCMNKIIFIVSILFFSGCEYSRQNSDDAKNI